MNRFLIFAFAIFCFSNSVTAHDGQYFIIVETYLLKPGSTDEFVLTKKLKKVDCPCRHEKVLVPRVSATMNEAGNISGKLEEFEVWTPPKGWCCPHCKPKLCVDGRRLTYLPAVDHRITIGIDVPRQCCKPAKPACRTEPAAVTATNQCAKFSNITRHSDGFTVTAYGKTMRFYGNPDRLPNRTFGALLVTRSDGTYAVHSNVYGSFYTR